MKDRPLFLKTFTTFAAMLLIIVFVIGTVFNYSLVHYSESEISKASIGKLRIIYNINDMLVENVNREALRLSIDSYLNTLNSGLKGYESMNYMNKTVNIRNIYSVLDQVVNANDAISSVYIYMEDEDLIISSNLGVGSTDTFYDTGWLKQYNENKEKGIKASWVNTRTPINDDILNDDSKLKVINSNRSKVMTYIFPLSTYTTPLNGAIIINVYENKFSRLINNTNNGEGNIFIIDNKGNVITHSDKTLVGTSMATYPFINEITGSDKREGYVISGSNYDKHLITYYKSEYNNWIYVGDYPLASLMDKSTALRFKILIYMAILVMIGFVAVFLFSKKLYSPVQELIQNIRNHREFELLDSKNEVTVLTKAFDSLIKQEKDLNSLLEKNKENIRNKYIIDMINGIKYSPEDMQVAGLEFTYQGFMCAVVGIDRYKLFLSRFTREQAQYMKTLIINIFEQVLGEEYICYGALTEKEKIVIIMNIPDDGKIQILPDGFKQIQEEIGKILENTITIGIGNIYTGVQNIRLSYNEAVEAYEMKFIKGQSRIIHFSDISTDNQQVYHYPVNHEKMIMNLLNNGSSDGVSKAVNALVTDVRSNENINTDNVKLIFNQLLGRVMEHLISHNFSVKNVFGENYNIYQQLATKETIDEVEVWLTEIFDTIISYSENRKVSDKKYIDKVLEYIHNNYKKDIDVNTMAQEIGISYSQLRRVFVEELGVNLVSYVNNLRIEEAKRVLVDSDKSIYDIALSLGYNNDQSFNRFFKKFEGITPGEFRNKNRKNP
jgi:AraC-type DNA-binding domain-containing proteins